jgi:hypothetical protein
LAVAAAVAMPLLPASASLPTSVTYNCTDVQARPRSIVFTCADGNFYVRRARWRSWHRYRAVGDGIVHRNDCRPSCAGGTFHTAPARLLLLDPIRCPGVRGQVFGRVRITYDGRLLGRHRDRWRLGCPI